MEFCCVCAISLEIPALSEQCELIKAAAAPRQWTAGRRVRSTWRGCSSPLYRVDPCAETARALAAIAVSGDSRCSAV